MPYPRCTCILCRKNIAFNGINTHYERVHLGLNFKYSSGNNGKYKNINEQRQKKQNVVKKNIQRNSKTL